MSDYRRLISYIYEYEGKEKGKNVGFVKLEARNGQCRLNLNVKKVYVGGNAIGVYLLDGEKEETFLGNIFVRNGAAEFRTVIDARNVEGTGKGLDTYYGLTIHDVKNAWRSYTTIWEDAVAHTAKEDLNALAPEKRTPEQVISTVVWQIEEELAREEERKNVGEPVRTRAAEIGSAAEILESPDETDGAPRTQEKKEESAKNDEALQNLNVIVNFPRKPGGTQPPEQFPATEKSAPAEEPAPPEQFPVTEKSAPAEEPAPPEQSPVTEKSAPAEEPAPPEPPVSPELENPEVLKYLQEAEAETSDPEKLWQEFCGSYPKIQPFDYDDGCEILTIKPQDIGRLPRETWVYGNNSFLMHGYYNFRYVILVRLGNSKGKPRYLLGVPGHYYSNEKYMASMFGFPNFVLSKKQPPHDGRFGYWYTDIRIG